MPKTLKDATSDRSSTPHAPKNDPRTEIIQDHLVQRALKWAMRHQRLAELERQWQRLETALFAEAAALRISCEAAMRGNSVEAKRMRALDAEIDASYRDLVVEAGEIQAMKSSSVAAALAKVELGLRVQGPFDWRDHARQLIDDGIGELKSMLEASSG